ncbi:MAG TPA: hypothetical protein VGB63_00165 [Pedobacter sp.]|jgi:hypothetical protein
MTNFSIIPASLKRTMTVALFLSFFLSGKAQQNQEHAPMGLGGTSHSEQAQDYRRFIEEPSGYDVPRGGLHTQPWVYTLTAAGLVLLIGVIYKSKTDQDFNS